MSYSYTLGNDCLGTQLLVEAETGNSYVVMANDSSDSHEHDDEDDDHMHFDPSAHSTLRTGLCRLGSSSPRFPFVDKKRLNYLRQQLNKQAFHFGRSTGLACSF